MTQASQTKSSEGDPVKVSSQGKISSQNAVTCSSQSVNKSECPRRQRYERRSQSIAETPETSSKPALNLRLNCRKKSVFLPSKSVRFKPQVVDLPNLRSYLQNLTDDNLISVAKLLAKLRHEFKNCSQSIQKFIEKPINGIDVLFNLLRKSQNHSATRPLPSFSWSYLQLEVLNCIREIMDSPVGIQQIIKDETDYAEKLASGK